MQSARNQARIAASKLSTTKAYPPGTVDYGPIVRAIQAAKPDIVYFASYPPIGRLVASTYEAKLTATVLGGGMIGPQITAIKAQFGPLLNNLVCWDIYAPEPTMKFLASTLPRALSRRRGKGEDRSARALRAAARLRPDAGARQAVSRVGKIDQPRSPRISTPIRSPPSSAT